MNIRFGKTITYIATGVLVVSSTAPVLAVPVVPNFQQGQMTSHTETTSEVTETINSMDYSTGYTYTVSGTGVKPSGSNILPSNLETTSTTLNGVTSQWTGLNLGSGSRPQWQQSSPGGNFSFVESYIAPGLQNHTIIQRTTTIQSVTDTTSIFTQ